MTWPLYVPFPPELGAKTFASRPAATTILALPPNAWFQAFHASATPWAEPSQFWGALHPWTNQQDHSTVLAGPTLVFTGRLHGPYGAAAITLDDFTISAADLTPTAADATSGKKLPPSEAAWYRFAPGLNTPYLLYLIQGTGTTLTHEEIRNTSAVASGTGGVAFSGWLRTCLVTVGFTGQNFTFPAAQVPNISIESILLMGVIEIGGAPGSNDAYFLTIGGTTSGAAGGGVKLAWDHNSANNQVVISNPAGTLAGGVAGSSFVYQPSTAYPFIVRINVTAQTIDFFSDKEKISVAWSAPSSATLVAWAANGLGEAADGDLTIAYSAMWRGANAEVSDAVVAEMIENPGWALSGWTFPIHGTTSVILGDTGPGGQPTSLVATGAVKVQGSASNTLDAFTDSAAGTIPSRGTASVTLDDTTDTGTGVVIVKGSSSVSLDATTDSASGTVKVAGSASDTIDDVTIVATGGASTDHGVTSETLDDVSVSSTGTVLVRGSASVTLDGTADSATGAVIVRGTGSDTLDDTSTTGAGAVVVAGVADLTLDDVTLESSAAVNAALGEADITLDNVAIDAQGTLAIRGTASDTIDDVSDSASARVLVTGSLSQTLDDVALVARISRIAYGELDVRLDDVLGGSIQGALDITLEDATVVGYGKVKRPPIRSGGMSGSAGAARAEASVSIVPVLEVGSVVRVRAAFTSGVLPLEPSGVVVTLYAPNGTRTLRGAEIDHESIGVYSVLVRLVSRGKHVVEFVGHEPDVSITHAFEVTGAIDADERNDIVDVDAALMADVERTLARARRRTMVDELRANGVRVDETRSDAYVEGQHQEMSRRIAEATFDRRRRWGG